MKGSINQITSGGPRKRRLLTTQRRLSQSIPGWIHHPASITSLTQPFNGLYIEMSNGRAFNPVCRLLRRRSFLFAGESITCEQLLFWRAPPVWLRFGWGGGSLRKLFANRLHPKMWGKKKDIGLQLLGPWAAAAADGRRALQVLDVWKPL